jgi:hypothetical protein
VTSRIVLSAIVGAASAGVVSLLFGRWWAAAALARAIGHQLGAAAAWSTVEMRAIPYPARCVYDCGRAAIDGHLTCGEPACDEKRARDLWRSMGRPM